VRTPAFALCCSALALATTRASAQGEPASTTLPPDAHFDIAPRAPEARPPAEEALAKDAEPTSLGEPPSLPSRPRHRGLVLESTLGVLGFGGQFRHVAPPASFMHAQLGYEVLSWLMLFGEAELAFGSTSESQDASHSRAFPLWGFGGGARAGHRIRDFGGFVQADLGALTARVPHDALAYLGYRGAESLGAQFGGRVGVEWYQRDRHIALTAQGGPRIAQGFAKTGAADLPLMWDAAVGLRYTF
jgi:hypothetical protein